MESYLFVAIYALAFLGSAYGVEESVTLNQLHTNGDSETTSPPILDPKSKIDIYEQAVRFLVNKRTRLEQQRILHQKLLHQYRKGINHPPEAFTVSRIDNDDNPKYSILTLDSNSSALNGTTHNLLSEEGIKLQYDLDSPAVESTSATNVSAEIQRQEEIDQLSNQVVDITLNQTSNGHPLGSSGGPEEGRAYDGVAGIFSRFSTILDLGRVVREIETSVMSSVSCSACRAGVGLLKHYIQSGRGNDEIINAATKLCINLKMQTARVCIGIIRLNGDEVIQVLKSVVLDSNDICALIIGESCGTPISPSWRWSVDFPPIPKPPFHGFPEPKAGAPQLKVLQISDTHWDPFYEPGTNSRCGEPLCCRITSGPKPPRPHLGAGLWGDYGKCDTPRNTLESMFEHISDVHKDLDYIIWTGDIPPHDVWNQTQYSNLQVIKETVNMMHQYFPHTPIFPALGNHESAPVNSFAPNWVTNPKFSIDWLYSELQKDWSRWLPDTTLSTIRAGAFYATSIKPGFKIISINTNYCNNKNWWLLINSTDPVDELKWLIFELQSSELANEKVHIIGHIPPGHSDCMATWSKNYYDIISRYEGTIAAQFFGHTHFDELELFYANEDPYRAASVAYIGPSVTPYYAVNPGYRIYYVDGDYPTSTRMVVDHETWIADLAEANRVRARKLPWWKLYSARDAYGLQSLDPLHWDDLVMSMYENGKLFDYYYRFYNKNSPVAEICDAECKTRLLCDIRSGKSHSREELCKPRPPHVRKSRGGILEPRPKSEALLTNNI